MVKALGLTIGMALCAGDAYDMPDPGSLILFLAATALLLAGLRARYE